MSKRLDVEGCQCSESIRWHCTDCESHGLEPIHFLGVHWSPFCLIRELRADGSSDQAIGLRLASLEKKVSHCSENLKELENDFTELDKKVAVLEDRSERGEDTITGRIPIIPQPPVEEKKKSTGFIAGILAALIVVGEIVKWFLPWFWEIVTKYIEVLSK